jgi:hypothetical protein
MRKGFKGSRGIGHRAESIGQMKNEKCKMQKGFKGSEFRSSEFRGSEPRTVNPESRTVNRELVTGALVLWCSGALAHWGFQRNVRWKQKSLIIHYRKS